MELIEHLPAVIYVAMPGEQGRWRYVSPQIERLLGYTAEAWMADPSLWARCVYEGDRARVLREEERDVALNAPTGSEYRMRARAGGFVWVRDEAVLRFDADGNPFYMGLLIDISERKQFESELQFLAEHDSLTGVSNRRRFLVELETELRTIRRQGRSASVLMLDLDGLKAVNDSLGHGAGDAVLKATAEALTQRLRESDTIARLGGDEFAVLLRGAGRERAVAIAGELIEAISAETLAVTQGQVVTNVSIGASEMDPHMRAPEAVLTQADHAMYKAKRAGGGVVEPQPEALAH